MSVHSENHGRPRLDVIIVNWNAGLHLGACVESLAGSSRSSFDLDRVVVVDNASTDGSIDRMPAGQFPLPLTIIRNDQNRGFAAACNQGARATQADFLLFLNPDVRLLLHSLDDAVDFLESGAARDVGICGIQLLDDRGDIARTCARFPTTGRFVAKMLGLDMLFPRTFPGHFMTEWSHGQTRDVDQVMGAFFLVREPLFRALAGFDERFFLYFEEVDLSLRAHREGWRTVYLANTQAYHRGAVSSEQIRARRLRYSLRSRILYAYKHFGGWSATALLASTLAIEPFSRLIRALGHGSASQISETLAGFAMFFTDVPQILRMGSLRGPADHRETTDVETISPAS